MELPDPREDVRRLLADMLAILDSSPDALQSSYGALRDKSYSLALQVRTAAMPNLSECRDRYVSEVTGRKW